MTEGDYIKVIVPVKLDRVLTYRVPDSLKGRVDVGSRVKVSLGRRITDAVVCETSVTPDIDHTRIHEIVGLEEGLEHISPEEIRLWQFIADYYLCTPGEVLKCAYPAGKVRSEQTAARVKGRAEASKRKVIDAARLRVTKLENEMAAVKERCDSALSKLSERSVKTRERLIRTRDERLEKLRDALERARKLLAALDSEAEATTPQSRTATAPKPGITPSELAGAILASPKPVLLKGGRDARQELYRELISATLSKGKGALLLVPEIALTSGYEAGLHDGFGPALQVFHSKESVPSRRKIADRVRQGGPLLIVGTRSALFLPFRDLGLMIVDEEQDRSYKQDSPAPRYNARDCAVVLAGIHGTPVVLGSGHPSLESLYNCSTGRYQLFKAPGGDALPTGRLRIIDTVDERRKRGMAGQFSRKLLEEMGPVLEHGNKVYLLRLWGDTSQTAAEVRELFPSTPVADSGSSLDGSEDASIIVTTLALTRNLRFEEGSLVALLQADPVLGAQDFRADERAIQLLGRYLDNCSEGRFIIQTGRSSHPMLEFLSKGADPSLALLEERRRFSYPPYSRIIDVIVRDSNDARREAMSLALERSLRLQLASELGDCVQIAGPFPSTAGEMTLRLIIRKGRQSSALKHQIAGWITAFEDGRKYRGFIRLDVDPE